MAKNTLPVNFQDDIMNSSMGGKRRYRMINNSDGTISLEDATTYDQVGSNFGAGQLNTTNQAVNESADKNKVIQDIETIRNVTEDGYIAGALALKQVDDSLDEVVTDIYVGDDGKLHKVQGGADSVLPFSTKIENVYHLSSIRSNSDITAPIDYKYLVLEGSTTYPITKFSINGVSCFDKLIDSVVTNSAVQRLFLNYDGKSGDVINGFNGGQVTFGILFIG